MALQPEDVRLVQMGKLDELVLLRGTNLSCACQQQNDRVQFDVETDYLPQQPNRGSQDYFSMKVCHRRLKSDDELNES